MASDTVSLGPVAGGVEQRVPGAELDPRPAVGLAGGLLGAVDCLPPRVHHRLGVALREDVLEAAAPARRELPGPGVLEQELDCLRRVLLVRADHAARAALDPAGRIEAR